jgi:predicted nucleotidyltransferase
LLATGTVGPDSDVDLAVECAEALTAEVKRRLIEDLAEAGGRPVDLVDLHGARPALVGSVLRQGKRLRGDTEAYARLVSRHLIDTADFLPYYRRTPAARRQAWIGR